MTTSLVILKGGHVVPAQVFRLVFELEASGFWLRCADASAIEIGPQNQVTDAIREALQANLAEVHQFLSLCTSTDLNAAAFTDGAAVHPVRRERPSAGHPCVRDR